MITVDLRRGTRTTQTEIRRKSISRLLPLTQATFRQAQTNILLKSFPCFCLQDSGLSHVQWCGSCFLTSEMCLFSEATASHGVPNILVVDDDRNFLRVLSYHLQEFGFQASIAASPLKAICWLKEKPFDVLITDLKMPGMDGLELLAEVRKFDPDLPVIVLTAYGSIETAIEALKKGATDFLTKPFEKEEMRQSIVNALKMAYLLRANRKLPSD